MRLLPALCSLLLVGCLTEATVVGDRCDVAVSAIDPDPASVGDTLTLSGGPFTSAYDTSVYVGNTRALVLDLERTSCNDCDTCRDNNGCTECDDCDDCDAVCALCEESVLVELPDVDAGETSLIVFNAYGATEPVTFTVAGASDTGSSDTGTSDTGSSDTGTSDTGTSDTGTSDTGTSDSGTSDSGTSDSGD